MRLLVLGDFHYKALANLTPAWYEITRNVAHQGFNYARSQKICHVVITGDIFNNYNPSQEDLIGFFSLFENYVDLFFHIYLGNHDQKDATVNSLAFMAYAAKYFPHLKFYMEPTQVDIEGVKCCFLPWPHKKHIKGSVLTFAHVPIKGAKADNNKVFTEGLVASNKTYWIVGDLHRFQKGKNWIFPGALFQLKNNDSHKRYMLDVNIRKGTIQIKRQRLHLGYRLKAVKLENEPKNWKFLNEKGVIWTIYADFTVPDHPSILRVLPLSKNAAEKVDLNAASQVSAFEPAKFAHHVKGFLRKNGVRKKKLPSYMKIFERAMKSVRDTHASKR